MTTNDNGLSMHLKEQTEASEQTVTFGDLEEDTSSLAFEPFTVGLAPSFWAHVPLLVAHVNSLKLINGINFLLVDHDSQSQILPISKVTLVGTIVCAERRSNGSVIYALDDGSGFIDCLHWFENPFNLPSLTGDDSEERIPLSVGALVKVLGRVECLSLHVDQTEPVSVLGHTLESQRCVREVHATVMQELTNEDGEREHWLRCQSLLRSNMNSTQLLAALGPEIQQQVVDRTSLPSVDDMCGEWRHFGTKCRCCLSYKDPLLCKSIPRPAMKAKATSDILAYAVLFQTAIAWLP